MAEPNPAEKAVTAREALHLGTERLKREGITGAALDMSLILAEAMGTNRLGLYLDLDRALSEDERTAAREMLARRLKREPVAYILGRREFYGLTFEISPAVLIPRPETEHLVEKAVLWLKDCKDASRNKLLADIGTGSGVIAVTVAHACPASRWIAGDISADALEVARRNAWRHGVDGQVEFRQGPLLEPITENLDAICANLPYVALNERETLVPEVSRWEPEAALFSGGDGLDLIRKLIAEAPPRVKSGGLLLLECGHKQAEAVADLLAAGNAWHGIRIHPDFAGIDRLIQAERV